MRTFFFIFFVLLCVRLHAQEDRMYSTWDLSKPASFPGGLTILRRFWDENVPYSDSLAEKGVGGYTVVVGVVEKDGAYSNIHILNPVGGGCGEALYHTLKSKWPRLSHAEANGHPVRQSYAFYLYYHALAKTVYMKYDGGTPWDDVFYEDKQWPKSLFVKAPLVFRLSPMYQRAVLEIPDSARAVRFNGTAVVECTVSAQGGLKEVRVVYDPGYGCGAAACAFITRRHPFWYPECIGDTCIEKKQFVQVDFVTDTAALKSGDQIFDAMGFTELRLGPGAGTYWEYKGPLSTPGTVKVDFVIEPDKPLSNIQIEATTDTLLAGEARRFLEKLRIPAGKINNMPCRVHETRYVYFNPADKVVWLVWDDPAVRPIPLVHKTYNTWETDTPIEHQFGARGWQALADYKVGYPQAALEQDIEGDVYLNVIYDGRNECSAEVFSSPGADLGNDAAWKAKVDSRYYWLPATVNGYPVRATKIVRVSYRLPKE